MENNKQAASGPTKKCKIEWVCDWCLETCLFQITRSLVKGNLPADLKALTPSQATNVVALHSTLLWFSVAGAVAASLAMLLRGRGRDRDRRALASVGLAFAIAIHCVIVWLLGVTLVTTPSDNLNLFLLSVVAGVGFIFFAAVDVNAVLVLLRPPGAGGEVELMGSAWIIDAQYYDCIPEN